MMNSSEPRQQTEFVFDGRTFDKTLDTSRLSTQFLRVLAVMRDGHWRTLREISNIVKEPESSVSARLRDMRKPKFGSYTVLRRRRDPAAAGIHEYKVLP